MKRLWGIKMEIIADTVVIAPHIDDEVLGCFSQLHPDTFICYLGVEDRDYVSVDERIEELKSAARKTGFKWELHDNIVNSYKLDHLIPIIENVINSVKPEKIFIPHYSYNQDHKCAYEAAMVALRPHDVNWFVKKVFVYEQVHNFIWPVREFTPNYFIPIDIYQKNETYSLYKSQVREHRSISSIRSLAELRGKQSMVDYAEAFECIRFVE